MRWEVYPPGYSPYPAARLSLPRQLPPPRLKLLPFTLGDQNVQVTVSLRNNGYTGPVNFTLVILASGGFPSFGTKNLPSGANSVQAVYGGDCTYQGSISSALAVNGAP